MKNKKQSIKCSECDYCSGLRRFGNTRTNFTCSHPDYGYIRNYFNKKRMSKMPGFLGYWARHSDAVPIETVPAWCPKKSHRNNKYAMPFIQFSTLYFACSAILPCTENPFWILAPLHVFLSHFHFFRNRFLRSSTAIWLNQLSAFAPCQCFTLAGIVMTVPGTRLTASLPSSWYHPSPAVQIKIWPPPVSAWWICQLLWQPGSNVTFAKNREHCFGSVRGFRNDSPEKYCEYIRFLKICPIIIFHIRYSFPFFNV